MEKILCIALNPAIDISSVADVVRHTHKTRTHDQQQFPGGGGINVARVLCELGATGDCELMFLSGGATGDLLQAMLRAFPVVQRPFPIHDPVRVAFAVREETSQLEYRFVPEGPLVTDVELQPLLEAVAETDAAYVVASGSLPRGVPDDTYVKIAKMAHQRRARFVLDTSGPALTACLSHAQAFLVKPSLGEFESFVGRKLQHDEVGPVAQEFVKKGCAQHIAVTLGSDGAVLASGDQVLRVPAIDVPVKSATGAGDSFVAGMVWSLAQGNTVAEAFRLGQAAGAATVMTAATELCHRQDVLALLEGERSGAS